MAASTTVGMKTARELACRWPGASRLAAGASQGQAPASAVAYGRALRERSFSTGLTAGLGSTSSSFRGAVSGGSRSSASPSKAPVPAATEIRRKTPAATGSRHRLPRRPWPTGLERQESVAAGIAVQTDGGMHRRGRKREADHLDAGGQKQIEIVLHRAAPRDAHQHRAISQRRPSPRHLFVAVRVQRVQLKADGASISLPRHARQRQMAHDHIAARQQHRGAARGSGPATSESAHTRRPIRPPAARRNRRWSAGPAPGLDWDERARPPLPDRAPRSRCPCRRRIAQLAQILGMASEGMAGQ